MDGPEQDVVRVAQAQQCGPDREPVLEVKPPRRSSAASRRASGSLASAGKPRRSTKAGGVCGGGRTRRAGRPASDGKQVRSTSCRRTTSTTARPIATTSSRPRSRRLHARILTPPAGLSCSRNQNRSCANDSGALPPSPDRPFTAPRDLDRRAPSSRSASTARFAGESSRRRRSRSSREHITIYQIRSFSAWVQCGSGRASIVRIR